MNIISPHCPYCQDDLRWEDSNWGFCDNCRQVYSLKIEAKYEELSRYQ